jgi:hypothetical protein
LGHQALQEMTTTNNSIPLKRVDNDFDDITIQVYVQTNGQPGTVITLQPNQGAGESEIADILYIPILEDTSQSATNSLVFHAESGNSPDQRIFAYEGIIWFTMANLPDNVYPLVWDGDQPTLFGWEQAEQYVLGTVNNLVNGGGWVIGVLDDGLGEVGN